MGKKTKVPKAPNYSAQADKQTAANKLAWQTGVQANRPDQKNAWGGVDWTQDPTTGDWTQTETLAPEYEALRQQQVGNQGGLAELAGQNIGSFDASQIDLSGAPAMPTVGGYNQQVIDTMRALQAPQLDRARAAKEQQLAAMGMGTGSGTAWNTEQQNIGDRESRADMQAIMGGIDQGNKEFTQGMQAHQTGVNDILQQRQGNLGQLSGLMGLIDKVKNPTFQNVNNVGTYNPADLMAAQKAQYDAALNKSNAGNADKSNTMGTIGTVASVAATLF